MKICLQALGPGPRWALDHMLGNPAERSLTCGSVHSRGGKRTDRCGLSCPGRPAHPSSSVLRGWGGSVAGVTDYCLQSKTDQADEASRLESLKGSENTLARGETQTTQLSVPLSVNVDNEL